MYSLKYNDKNIFANEASQVYKKLSVNDREYKHIYRGKLRKGNLKTVNSNEIKTQLYLIVKVY